MKKCLSFLFLASILVFSPNLEGLSGEHQLPEVPRISADMAYLEYKTGTVLIVDAMNKECYAKYHILGAVSLPGDGPADIERIKNANLPIPINKEIIVYCD
jgi:rhodanese-related sulfurtransferase